MNETSTAVSTRNVPEPNAKTCVCGHLGVMHHQPQWVHEYQGRQTVFLSPSIAEWGKCGRCGCLHFAPDSEKMVSIHVWQRDINIALSLGVSAGALVTCFAQWVFR